MADKRDHERHLIRRYAILKLINGETIEGRTKDMSIGGAFIECKPDSELREGDICRVSIVLEDEVEPLSTEIYGSISHRTNYGVGFNFLKIDSVYYQFMTNFFAET